MTATTTTDSSRAQKLRQRRSQVSGQRLERVNTPARASSRAVPPVIVRGSSAGSPLLNRTARRRPRRIFFLNLGTNVELASPAIPVIRPGWRILSGMVFAVLLGTLIFILSSDMFKVSAAQLNGLERLSAADVEAALNLNSKLIFAVDPAAVRTSLTRNFPELFDISIRVGLPGYVSIQAAERAPILAWKQKDQVFWIDAQGFTFAARGEALPLVTVQSSDAPPEYPLPADQGASADGNAKTSQLPQPELRTLYSGARVDLNVVAAALTLNPYVPEKHILTYDKEHGLGWKDPRGWAVYFGYTLEDIEMKLVMYKAVVQQLVDKNITPNLVSIENIDTPYYRLER